MKAATSKSKTFPPALPFPVASAQLMHSPIQRIEIPSLKTTKKVVHLQKHQKQKGNPHFTRVLAILYFSISLSSSRMTVPARRITRKYSFYRKTSRKSQISSFQKLLKKRLLENKAKNAPPSSLQPSPIHNLLS
jgi:hypothetical protein